MAGAAERHYRVADRILLSDLPLPASPVPTAVPAWRVRHAADVPGAGVEYHAWRVDGRPFLTFARAGRLRLLIAHRVATFAIDDDAGEIRWRLAPRGDLGAAQHVLVNHVLPLALSRERLILHASAVQVGGVVLGFFGAKGRGKSTLAAAFSRAGGTVLTDDALVVERRGSQLVAVPFGTGARLWPDSAAAVLGGAVADALPRVGQRTPKRWVAEDDRLLRFEQRAARIARLYLVEVPRTRRVTRIEPLAGAAAVFPLLASAMQLHLDEPACVRATFERVLELVNEVPVRRLRHIGRFDALDEVVRQIREDS